MLNATTALVLILARNKRRPKAVTIAGHADLGKNDWVTLLAKGELGSGIQFTLAHDTLRNVLLIKIAGL